MSEFTFLTDPKTPIEVFDAYVHAAQALAISANERLDKVVKLRNDYLCSEQDGVRLQLLLLLRKKFHGLANILILARLEKYISELETTLHFEPFP